MYMNIMDASGMQQNQSVITGAYSQLVSHYGICQTMDVAVWLDLAKQGILYL